MSQLTLRELLRKRIRVDNVSLRELSLTVGVSFATLSRFLRGFAASEKTLECVNAYLNGKDAPIFAKKHDVEVISYLRRLGFVHKDDFS